MLDETFICDIAEYTIDNNATVRSTAAVFNIGKSTVHRYLTEELPYISPNLWNDVQGVIKLNKDERHIRGGQATKYKYQKLKHKHTD